jgi:virginiamycin B lyase
LALTRPLWFTAIAIPNRIGRATPDGQVAEYELPTPDAGLLRLAVGPDGGVWFLECKIHAVGRITMDGQITEFPGLDMAAGPGIAIGPDGAVWFTSFDGNRIERMTLDGQVTGYAVPTEKSNPYHIVAGPDRALWFTEMDGNAIGRVALNPTTSVLDPVAATDE